MKVRHTVSRFRKFDVSQSAYPYIRLDLYAPEQNRTAIYLGPVKTKKAVRTIYLPQRAKEAFLVMRAIETQLAAGRPGFNPNGLVFCTEEGHPLEAKTLKEFFWYLLDTTPNQACEPSRHQTYFCHGSIAKDHRYHYSFRDTWTYEAVNYIGYVWTHL